MATTDYSLERGLPVSMEAERSILGAVLLDNSLYDQAAEHLTADDFSLDAHRRIYSRMRELQETGRPVDMITLVEELDRRKEVEAIGGVAYLSSLIDGVPERPSIEHYVRIVRNKALLRGLINVAQNAIAEAIEHSDEADEVIGRAEQAIFQLSENRIGQGFMNIPEIIRGSFGSLEELYARGQEITGLATHYALLDKLTSGLQPSDLIIVAARPSVGKTAFAMNIAENAAVRDGKVVGVFSLEMSREALLMRMLASHAQVDSKNLRQGFLTKDDMRKLTQATEELTRSRLYIDDTPGISVSEMRAKARQLKRKENGLDLLVIDYLQLMSAVPIGGKRFENRTQEVSAISRGLKSLAKELRVPVLALSQLSRAPESRGGDHRPQLSDLRESGSIEQDADVVAFIFREEMYKKDDPDLDGIAEIIVAKQRNGPTATIRMAFIKRYTRFENLAEESEYSG
ncbi:MAG TPA: replicative DNA helicase [Candidatus Binatia bacterium]|nr:replicative DNA helicase [Candidatus Binatia bacterium]